MQTLKHLIENYIPWKQTGRKPTNRMLLINFLPKKESEDF